MGIINSHHMVLEEVLYTHNLILYNAVFNLEHILTMALGYEKDLGEAANAIT